MSPLHVLLQVLSVSPELQKMGEVTKVTAYTSDLIELVSGVCPVSLMASSTLPVRESRVGGIFAVAMVLPWP